MTQKRLITLPTMRESIVMLICLAVWLTITASFVGWRPEHGVMAVLIAALFFFNGATRRLIVALVPFALFGISYDWMNLLPNYEVNPVDIQGLYESEKDLFGIATATGTLTPNEYFAIHNCRLMDFMAGVFYLCWVPVPILFGLWLYFDRQRKIYLHFALVFLLVNLIGFAGYYIHPAAPPWYVAMHGFDFIPGTHGEVAGLGKFDAMTGLGIFQGLYGRNANVFAAVPSLHSAYMVIAMWYALKARVSNWIRLLFAIIVLGIWFTAVYTSHHYLIDVILGATTAVAGIALFELVLMRIPSFSRWIDRYNSYITA
ncbi:MAG: phosphatase PAP2 family protein [Muribaculaceae bacterium]|nr:phosphatase PAP2 family protein [Muribaculaceae bacterium]